MENFETINVIFDFAIENEIEAYKFYTGLAAKMDNMEMKKVFLDFAAEEQKHKEILEAAKKNKKIHLDSEKIADLKIADFTVNVKPTENMKYQDALVLAMKKERKAFQLYTCLSMLMHNKDGSDLFTSLAQQEAKHKLRFEMEYDNVVLKED